MHARQTHASNYSTCRRGRIPVEAGGLAGWSVGPRARRVLARNHSVVRGAAHPAGSHRGLACGRCRAGADDGHVSRRCAIHRERVRHPRDRARDRRSGRESTEEWNVRILTRVTFIAIIAAVTAACTLGPNYKRPAVAVPDVHRGAAAAANSPASLADLKWFELFRDDQLTALVSTALKQNFELRIAAERVLQARAVYGIQRSDQFPSARVSAAINTVRSPEAGANVVPSGADTNVTYTEAGFSLGWELDVWGRLRRLSEAARARYLATAEARHGVITTLVADVTETYLTLRALDYELEIARRTRDVANDSIRDRKSVV